MNTQRPITLFLLALFLLPAGFTRAQIDVESLLPGPGSFLTIDISSQPKYPTPNRSVVVSLSSFSTDLNRAQISWYVGGALFESGTGLTSITTSAPASGSSRAVSATITTAEGITTTKTLTLRPGDLDLIWEAESYTPPFYRGKALYPISADLKIVAMPSMRDALGNPIPSTNLIYTWEQDGKVLGSKSGYGKNTLRVMGSVLGRSIQIAVTAETSDKTRTAKKTITVPTTSPRVTLYENHPLLGTRFDRALLGTTLLVENEMRIAAIPYFFSGDFLTALQYSWRLGGQPISDPGNEIVVRHEGGTQGTTGIVVEVVHPIDVLQNATESLSVSFGS